jgi:hypothetical protein
MARSRGWFAPRSERSSESASSSCCNDRTRRRAAASSIASGRPSSRAKSRDSASSSPRHEKARSTAARPRHEEARGVALGVEPDGGAGRGRSSARRGRRCGDGRSRSTAPRARWRASARGPRPAAAPPRRPLEHDQRGRFEPQVQRIAAPLRARAAHRASHDAAERGRIAHAAGDVAPPHTPGVPPRVARLLGEAMRQARLADPWRPEHRGHPRGIHRLGERHEIGRAPDESRRLPVEVRWTRHLRGRRMVANALAHEGRAVTSPAASHRPRTSPTISAQPRAGLPDATGPARAVDGDADVCGAFRRRRHAVTTRHPSAALPQGEVPHLRMEIVAASRWYESCFAQGPCAPWLRRSWPCCSRRPRPRRPRLRTMGACSPLRGFPQRGTATRSRRDPEARASRRPAARARQGRAVVVAVDRARGRHGAVSASSGRAARRAPLPRRRRPGAPRNRHHLAAGFPVGRPRGRATTHGGGDLDGGVSRLRGSPGRRPHRSGARLDRRANRGRGHRAAKAIARRRDPPAATRGRPGRGRRRRPDRERDSKRSAGNGARRAAAGARNAREGAGAASLRDGPSSRREGDRDGAARRSAWSELGGDALAAARRNHPALVVATPQVELHLAGADLRPREARRVVSFGPSVTREGTADWLVQAQLTLPLPVVAPVPSRRLRRGARARRLAPSAIGSSSR